MSEHIAPEQIAQACAVFIGKRFPKLADTLTVDYKPTRGAGFQVKGNAKRTVIELGVSPNNPKFTETLEAAGRCAMNLMEERTTWASNKGQLSRSEMQLRIELLRKEIDALKGLHTVIAALRAENNRLLAENKKLQEQRKGAISVQA